MAGSETGEETGGPCLVGACDSCDKEFGPLSGQQETVEFGAREGRAWTRAVGGRGEAGRRVLEEAESLGLRCLWALGEWGAAAARPAPSSGWVADGGLLSGQPGSSSHLGGKMMGYSRLF